MLIYLRASFALNGAHDPAQALVLTAEGLAIARELDYLPGRDAVPRARRARARCVRRCRGGDAPPGRGNDGGGRGRGRGREVRRAHLLPPDRRLQACPRLRSGRRVVSPGGGDRHAARGRPDLHDVPQLLRRGACLAWRLERGRAGACRRESRSHEGGQRRLRQPRTASGAAAPSAAIRRGRSAAGRDRRPPARQPSLPRRSPSTVATLGAESRKPSGTCVVSARTIA